MGSEIPRTIRIRNPHRGIQNPRLSRIHFLHEANLVALLSDFFEYKGHSFVQRTSKQRGISLDKQTDQKVRSNNNYNK